MYDTPADISSSEVGHAKEVYHNQSNTVITSKSLADGSGPDQMIGQIHHPENQYLDCEQRHKDLDQRLRAVEAAVLQLLPKGQN